MLNGQLTDTEETRRFEIAFLLAAALHIIPLGTLLNSHWESKIKDPTPLVSVDYIEVPIPIENPAPPQVFGPIEEKPTYSELPTFRVKESFSPILLPKQNRPKPELISSLPSIKLNREKPIPPPKIIKIAQLPKSPDPVPLPVVKNQKAPQILEIPEGKSEITGPLKDRKIQRPFYPRYPSWAKEQNIEASVSISFMVSPKGDVLKNMRVVRTSGYSKLDTLAMSALKKWKFSPLQKSTENQSGIITFRFLLD